MVWCSVALATDDYRVIIFEVRDLCGLCPSTCLSKLPAESSTKRAVRLNTSRPIDNLDLAARSARAMVGQKYRLSKFEV